ncbi:ComEA family DNA-binding protein [Bacteroides sp.]
MWKDFFYFSRTERRGVLILAVLIVLVCTASWFIPTKDVTDIKEDPDFEKEYTEFIASIKEREHSQNTNYKRVPFQQRKVVLAPFDPNTADSVSFLNLGLPSWMAGNILRYRAKGGKFRQPADFRKVYGLTEEQYTTLSPYISIAEKFAFKDTIRLLSRRKAQDTLLHYKYPAGTVINLNQADTTELKKIPGIGSAIARMIVGYRKQLGGFYKVEQLQDIHLSVDKLHEWLAVNENGTQRINLNKVGIERLKAHPYINFYQAKIIVEYRKKKGKIQSLEQLKLYEEFSEKDFERISPYICFE